MPYNTIILEPVDKESIDQYNSYYTFDFTNHTSKIWFVSTDGNCTYLAIIMSSKTGANILYNSFPECTSIIGGPSLKIKSFTYYSMYAKLICPANNK